MLLFICAREALRTLRRLDGPEPLVNGEFLNLPLRATAFTLPLLKGRLDTGLFRNTVKCPFYGSLVKKTNKHFILN
jgi:hypothetical protein